MSPIQTNTQIGVITVNCASDFSGNIGCFAKIDSTQNAALPASHGLALYVVDDAYQIGGSSGTYQAVLRPLSSDRNVRVIAAQVIACGAQVTTDSAGKAVSASSGNNILAISEEAAVVGQYVLLRPLGGIQTA